MLRPPEGWEARGSAQSSRWAWGTETKSSLQKNLAPHTLPKHWEWRLAGIVLLTWIIIIFSVLFLVVVPVSIGREVQSLLRVPSYLRHDPMGFLIGTGVCLSVCWVLRCASPLLRRYGMSLVSSKRVMATGNSIFSTGIRLL